MKLNILLFVVYILCGCETTKKQFILNGEIEGKSTHWIKVAYTNANGIYVLDSVELINNKFSYSGRIQSPTMLTFSGNTKSRSVSDSNWTEFYIEPKKMTIKGKENYFKLMYPHNSKTHKEFIDFSNIKHFFTKEIDSLKKQIESFKGSSNTEVTNIQKQINTIRSNELNYRIQFTKTNPNSYLNVDNISYLIDKLPIDTVKYLFESLNRFLKVSFKGLQLGKEIKQKQETSVGSQAKNFQTISLEGVILDLDSIRKDKYLLLDFWASWCMPCRKGSPNLIKWYSAYQSKGFEIISIANDDTRREAWLKAIKIDGTGAWKHVLQGVGTANDIGELYAVQPIPDKILIDKNGIIIYRHVGDDDSALEKKLKELFEN